MIATAPLPSPPLPFERVDVIPDSPAWLEERRSSIGASEVPAILGLSPWATPLDVYRSKLGAGRDMDPELAFIGHAEEVVIGRWLRKFRPELGMIRRGFMARSLEAPWIHASIDRFLVKRGAWIPVQMKTAHQYAGDEWTEEAPLPVQAQIQTELFALGAPYGYAVAFIGGRRFQIHRVEREEDFIREVLLPQTRAFWLEHVEARIPPEPSTSAEASSLWAGGEGDLEADEELANLWLDLRDAQAHAKEAEVEVDRLRLEIQKRMREHTALVHEGRILATWKPKAGARRLDSKALRADHPDLADAYTRQGEPSRTFLVKSPKEQS